MFLALLLILSILPAIILGKMIYNYDKVEKEPIKLLFKLFFSGIGAVILTIILSIVIFILFPSMENTENLNLITLILHCFIFVSLVEESSKMFFLKRITWNNKEFNYIYDAIVYAVFVSLGFATVENILYIVQGDLFTAVLRAILSVPGHAFFGVFMGYYYGLSKQSEINQNYKLSSKNMRLSLIMPVLIHGMFDYCLFSKNGYLVIVYFIFVITLYIKAFKKIKQLSRIEKSFAE